MNPEPHDADGIDRAVRRAVGIAALRRIRRIVDAENAQDERNRRWARRLTALFVLAALLLLAWIGIR